MATGVRAQDSVGLYISGPFSPAKLFPLARTRKIFSLLFEEGDQLIDWVLNYLAEHEEKMEPSEVFAGFSRDFFFLYSLPFFGYCFGDFAEESLPVEV